MDERTNERTNERKFPCVLQDFVPFRAAAQKPDLRPERTDFRPYSDDFRLERAVLEAYRVRQKIKALEI